MSNHSLSFFHKGFNCFLCLLSLFLGVECFNESFTFPTMQSCFHPDVHTLTAMFTFTFPMFKYSLSLSQISTMKSCFHPNVHPLTAIFTHRTIPCGRIFSSASFLYPPLQCHHQISLLISALSAIHPFFEQWYLPFRRELFCFFCRNSKTKTDLKSLSNFQIECGISKDLMIKILPEKRKMFFFSVFDLIFLRVFSFLSVKNMIFLV